MIRNLSKAAAASIFLFMATGTSASANDAKGNHAVWGLGQSSCNGYNKARADQNFGDFKNYLMGYVTAYNTVASDTYSVSGSTNLDGLLTRIDEYCRKTPTDSFEHALSILVAELHEQRSRQAPSVTGWGRSAAPETTREN
jgi:hypothetical protein